MNTPKYIKDEIESKLKWLAEMQVEESEKYRTKYEQMIWYTVALKLKQTVAYCKMLEKLHERQTRKTCIMCGKAGEYELMKEACSEECSEKHERTIMDMEDETQWITEEI